MTSGKKVVGLIGTSIAAAVGISYHYYISEKICPSRWNCVYKEYIISDAPAKECAMSMVEGYEGLSVEGANEHSNTGSIKKNIQIAAMNIQNGNIIEK